MLIERRCASLLAAIRALGAGCLGETDETPSEDDELPEETRLRDERVVVSQHPLGDVNLQPKSGTPGDWVTDPGIIPVEVFRSKRDNPVLTASITRRSTQESQINPAENAAATIRYRLTLSPFPYDQMNPYADANDASGSIAHSVFGTRLSASQNSYITLLRDDWDLSAYSEGTTNFRLHPDVKLGRVRVVSFYVNVPFQTRISSSTASYVFDDVRVDDVSVHTTPSENPADVIVQDITSKGFINQPDDIWTQCDIQWRLVNYYNCQLDAATFENTAQGSDGCPSENFINGRETALQQAANACAGAPKVGDRTVIFFGGFVNPDMGCTLAPIATAEGNYVHMTVGASGNVLSHELGHTLGLPHASQTTQLMHVSSTTGTTLTSSECTTARGAL